MFVDPVIFILISVSFPCRSGHDLMDVVATVIITVIITGNKHECGKEDTKAMGFQGIKSLIC